MALTVSWKQRKALVQDGMFLSEVRAWHKWNWKDSPWMGQLRDERKSIVKQWLRETGRKRRDVTPETLRRSGAYQRMVNNWYRSHGWIQKDGRKDVFAALRGFRDPWAKSPQGRDYIPPWYARRNEARKRSQAIDEQFSTAATLEVL